FFHWRVDADELRRLLPPEAPLDTWDGEAWLGIVPFRITNMRLRGLPPVPGLSRRVVLHARRGEPLARRGGEAPLPAAVRARAHELRASRGVRALRLAAGGR